MLGVPEELGGAVDERSAVTTTLITEALAYGDMGLAFAVLAPGGVATALGLWGDADQQATYLPEFAGEDVPAAALAVLEPRPLFDPFELETTATREPATASRSTASSRWSPRAADAELFVVAAELDGTARRCSSSSPATEGVSVEARAGDGPPRRRHRPRSRSTASSSPAGAAARRRRSRGLRRVHPPRPDRLVRRWRSAPPRPCSTT